MTSLDKDTKHNHFASSLLRHVVWYHFYLHYAKYDLRQRVCDRLGIQVTTLQAHNQHVKTLKA